MRILGLSFFYHDSAACLLVDGAPVAMAEEERFSRRKHDAGWPELAVRFVLEEGKIEAKDLDWAVFYEKPFLKLDRLIKTALEAWPLGPAAWAAGIRLEFEKKLWIRQIVADKLGIPPEKVLFSGHHLSHAASAYFPSPFERAAILTVDGVGEWATTTLASGEGNRIEVLKELRFPHSLGLLYSAFTAFLGFEVNEGEYKVMGMAPYGTPKHADKVRRLLRAREDGSFELDMSYFRFDRSTAGTFTGKFVDLFGEPRDPASKFFTRTTGWPSYFGPRPPEKEYGRLAERQEYYADVAASLQEVLEERLIALAREAHRLTGAETLCLSGGVALNSVANAKLVSRTPFRRLFIQPAAGDAGGAHGAALAVHHLGLGGDRRHRFEHAAWGKAFSEAEVAAALEAAGVRSERPDDDRLLPLVARELADGKVVGWHSGRFEWGPRALGSRSILADPRRADMKDVVNVKIKFREPYRPFAPSVLAEQAREWFALPEEGENLPARYMLYVVPVRPERRARIPAVTHVDGSARPQLVLKGHAPRYHALIEEFRKLTGVPMLLNTSFNLKGEPIVASPLDALKTFARSGMDLLVLGDRLVRRADLPPAFVASLTVPTAPRSGASVRRFLKGLGFVLLSLLLTLAALELGVRLLSKPLYPILRADPEVGTIHEPGVAKMLWNDEAGREIFVRTNAQGYVGDDFRSEKPPGTLRVAFFGDSMTEALQVDHDRGFVPLLERAIGIAAPVKAKQFEFMNFAVGGSGTFLQYRTYAKRAAAYRPDVVAVMFHGNDFGDNLAKAGLDPDAYREEPDRRSGLKDFLLRFELPKFVFARLQHDVRFLRVLSALGLYDLKPEVERAVTEGWVGAEEDPRFYDWTFGLLKRFRDRVRQDGGRFVIVAVPDEAELGSEENWRAYGYNRRLEAFVKDEKIEFINPAKALSAAKTSLPAGECLTYGCNGHYRERGHEAMAAALYPPFVELLKRLK
jgi:carbamoyltransferase